MVATELIVDPADPRDREPAWNELAVADTHPMRPTPWTHYFGAVP